MEAFLLGMEYMFSEPITFLMLLGGVALGAIFGTIPGLTATLGVVLILPFTFGLPPAQGFSILIGIYVGGISGGLLTAILFNIPGTPGSLVTCFDGYPMAKRGEANKALSLGIFAALIGGLFSGVALLLIAPQLARVALAFGSWEYFSLGVLGLSVVIMLTSKDPIKGVFGALLGLLLGAVGLDPVSADSRLTFGAWQLMTGLSMLPVMMGFFAIREILLQSRLLKTERELIPISDEKTSFFPSRKNLKGTRNSFLIGSIMGTIVGILPGIGQATGSLLGYNQTRQFSKTPEKFGTGHSEGIIASETGNDAVCGGALIPMMALGIPGDLITAVLLGGLIVHGLQPGPLLFTRNLDLVGAIILSFFLANILMFVFQMGFLRLFIKIVQIPRYILFPVVLVMCVLGTYAANYRLFDLWVLLGCGLVGYFLSECEVNMPPIVLGYILGPIIESNFRTAMYASRGDVLAILNQPIALVMLFIAVVLATYPYIQRLRLKMSPKSSG